MPDLFAMLPFEFPPILFHDVQMGTELPTKGSISTTAVPAALAKLG